MGAVYRLTLRQLSGKWRLSIMAVLSTLPVIIAFVMLGQSDAPTVEQFEKAILSAMLAGSITPLIVLATSVAAFSNEIEDRTLANLTLAPIPRWQIVLPKLLATITIAAPFACLSAFLTSHIAFLADNTATLAITVSALVSVALYASAFVWLGLVSPQAVGLGLLYIVLWEGFFSGFVAGVRLLSIRYYAIALMNAIDPRRFAEQFAGADAIRSVIVIAMCLLVFVGFTFLSIRRLRQMDVP
jgi:ABC-2 type transport system permease protein